MLNVATVNAARGTDFPYTDAQLRQIAQAVRNEAYPPQGRHGVGAAIRKAT